MKIADYQHDLFTYAKLLLGLAKGKHDYDKRESIKRREQNRDIARVMKQYNTP